ncbi:MAG: glycosyltransferase family 39 protein [FCB group bacterium]|nr:glycosyltransferase family 39 protein [FCB group bacterium]
MKDNPGISGKAAQTRRHEIILLLAIMAVAAAVRLFNLGGFSMWFDEAYSWHLGNQAVPRIVELAKIDNTPPVYHVLLHYWIKAGAESDFMIRLPAAFFGILSIFFTFRLGKLIFGPKTALLAAGISALSFQLVHYSQENRMYSLQLLLGLISTYYFVLGLRSGDRKHFLIWALSIIVSFYTQLFTVFLVFAQWVYFLTTIKSGRTNLLNWILANALVLIACVPWITVTVNQMGAIQEDYWVLPATLLEIVKVSFRLLGGTDFGDRYVLTALLNLPLIAACGWGLAGLFRDKSSGERLLPPLLFFLPVLTVFLLSLGRQSLFYFRYFVFLIPYLHLMMAYGLARLPDGWKKSAAQTAQFVVLVVFLISYYAVPAYSELLRMPLRNAADHLIEHAAPSAPVIHSSPGNIGMNTFYTGIRYTGGSFREYVWRDGRPPFYFGGSLYRDEYGLADLGSLADEPVIWVESSIYGDGALNEAGLPTYIRRREDINSPPAVHPDRLWIELENAGYGLNNKTWFGATVVCEFVKGDN